MGIHFTGWTSINVPKFQGEAATRAAQAGFYQGHEFPKVLRADKDPYVGRLPAAVRRGFSSEKAANRAIDAVVMGLRERLVWPYNKPVVFRQNMAEGMGSLVARALKQRSLTPLLPANLFKNARQLSIPLGDRNGGREATLTLAGNGMFGAVFKLDVPAENGKVESYALKIYKDPDPQPNLNFWRHGAYAEVASGAFLSQWTIKNLARFYAGNPVAGWTLDEWIPADVDREARPGRYLSDVFNEQDLVAEEDFYRPHNSIRGIHTDRGGIQRGSPGGPGDDDGF